MKNLFQKQNIILSSGKQSDFKIECDALTNEDWKCLAYLISEKIKFREVHSVPTGGDKLCEMLTKHKTYDDSLPELIVDDVLTTGGSMETMRRNINHNNIIGVVIFSRGKCPDWITPVFQKTF